MLRVELTAKVVDVETGDTVETTGFAYDLVTTKRGIDMLDIATIDSLKERLLERKRSLGDEDVRQIGYFDAIEQLRLIRQETLDAMDRWHNNERGKDRGDAAL